MAALLLRGEALGVVDAVLFDKDGTLSCSEPKLLDLARRRVQGCLEAVEASLQPALRCRLNEAYGLLADGVHPAGITAVAARDHNLFATATALAQVGLGWPEALRISEQVFASCDTVMPTASISTNGAIDTILRLRAAGLRCAVISNDTVAGIEAFLAEQALAAHVDAIWSAEHQPRKPDPAAVHGLCAQLGVAVDRCALIGDANSDLQMAVEAGIPPNLALGYTAGWSLHPPLAAAHPWIAHWNELTVEP